MAAAGTLASVFMVVRGFASEFHPWNRAAKTVRDKLRVTGVVVLVTSLMSLALMGSAAFATATGMLAPLQFVPSAAQVLHAPTILLGSLGGGAILTLMMYLNFASVVKITAENLTAMMAFSPVAAWASSGGRSRARPHRCRSAGASPRRRDARVCRFRPVDLLVGSKGVARPPLTWVNTRFGGRRIMCSKGLTMDFLAFARGPALVVSVTVFVLGTIWRLAGIFRRPRMRDLSSPREGAPPSLAGALRSILRGLWPRREFRQPALGATVNGYVMHLGLALVALCYAPHIAFVRRVTGLHWPALPDVVMYLAAGVTIVSLLAALVGRLTDPVLETISGADDYISWLVVFLPFVTGMAVLAEPSAAALARERVLYPGPLAAHLLSLELLLVWFPFGKLMHPFLFVLSRGATGIRFSHRGVAA